MYHWELQPIIVCSNDVDLVLIYAMIKFDKIGFSIAKGKTLDFSESIAASDLKVGRCRQLIELK